MNTIPLSQDTNDFLSSLPIITTGPIAEAQHAYRLYQNLSQQPIDHRCLEQRERAWRITTLSTTALSTLATSIGCISFLPSSCSLMATTCLLSHSIGAVLCSLSCYIQAYRQEWEEQEPDATLFPCPPCSSIERVCSIEEEATRLYALQTAASRVTRLSLLAANWCLSSSNPQNTQAFQKARECAILYTQRLAEKEEINRNFSIYNNTITL